MRNQRSLACLAAVAAVALPTFGLAAQYDAYADDFRLPFDSAARTSPFSLTQRNTNKTTGDTMIVIGAVIIVGGLGAGSGAGQALVLGAGGFLIAMGNNGEPTFDPWASGLKMGYWRGAPTASYTLFRF